MEWGKRLRREKKEREEGKMRKNGVEWTEF
jgi:hypothetical protein